MGALDDLRVVDLSRLAPGPYCSMLLADMGADVVRVDPVGAGGGIPGDPLARGKRSIALNLKLPDGQAVLHKMVETADVLLEGFRPGVADRLGAGYEPLSEINPGLVYCSLTGWGQDGPLAHTAGHDIDYIAIAGALEPVGRAGERPIAALNLIADFGGGGLMAAFGILAALLEKGHSGQGQHVDAAMVDGAISLMTMHYGFQNAGVPVGRGQGLLDTGAPFYEVYETADGKFMAVGAIEPQFFQEFWEGLGGGEASQMDRDSWPAMKDTIAARFKERTRAQWEEVFAGSDACVAPVLALDEAVGHPHNVERSAFVELEGRPVPAPSPRLARTPGAIRGPAPSPGQHTDEILAALDYSPEEVTGLRATGAVG